MKNLRVTAAAAAALFAGAAAAQQISISAQPQGTASYAMASAIAKAITEKAGMPARVQPFSGSSAAIPPVNAGEIDFTVCNEIEAVEAQNGEGSYAGRKQDNLRMVSILYPFTVAIYVKKDSPLRTIADLKGKRMTWGYTAQVTMKQVVGSILANGGLSEKDITPVLVPNVNRGADDFAAGRSDAFFHATGTGKVTETDAAVGGVRALQMNDAPQAVAAVKNVLPQGYVVEIKPRSGLAGINEPTKVLGYDYTFVVGKHVKDEVVYRVVKTLAENKELLAASFAGFNGFQPTRLARKMEVQFHPGAIKFLQETNQWPLK